MNKINTCAEGACVGNVSCTILVTATTWGAAAAAEELALARGSVGPAPLEVPFSSTIPSMPTKVT